jgi:TPR repeat protein
MALFKDSRDYEIEGLMHDEDGDYRKAVQCFRKALEKNDGYLPELAILKLARYHEEGSFGIPQNYACAANLYRKVAAYSSWANYKLGCFYEMGWGVPKNLDRAVEYYVKAFDMADGDSPASWRPPRAALLRLKPQYPYLSRYV